MDAFLSKPITPEKLQAVLAASGAPGTGEVLASGAATTAPSESKIELTLIRRLSDGSPEGLQDEVARFVLSLDDALAGVAAAYSSGSRSALSSAAHRVLSHARMVGGAALAGSASDLQEFAAAYTEAELAREMEILGARAVDLKETVARLANAPGATA
jgi:HPt (histidine-containing phosphotransfer) domain-containing protein